MILRTCLIGAAMLALPFAAAAEIYKWVDKDGKVHYSQTPPKKGKAEEVTPAPQPPISGTSADSADDSGAANLQDYVEEVSKANAERDQSKRKREQLAASRQAECDRARSRLAVFDRYGRIGTLQADGSIQAFDDNRREQERQAAQREVESKCQ